MSRLLEVVGAAERVIFGKPQQIRLCLACLLARGHLGEDVPGCDHRARAGTGAGFEWRWLRFTSDLPPADVIGAPGSIAHPVQLPDRCS
jgi:MoxR-like ATPase